MWMPRRRTKAPCRLWGCLMGGANLVLHAAGWLGGGLTASFEKLIVDAEMLQMMAAYFEPFEVSTATLALDAIRDVGPAGHFFGTAHTIERYEHAFYAPLLSNWDNHDTWVEKGRVDAYSRANTIWKRCLPRMNNRRLTRQLTMPSRITWPGENANWQENRTNSLQ